MQDRFKFRAWNEKEHKYLDDDSFEAKIYHNATELLGVCLALDKGNAKYDYVFEQCTGLKDKNGKLIYEGDIVLCSDVLNLYQIKWNKELARFVLNLLKGTFIMSHALSVSDPQTLEVIGNIHENADLLKEDEDDN